MADLSRETLDELTAATEYRAAVYSLLTRCFFTEPDVGLVQAINGKELRGALEEAGVVFDGVFDENDSELRRSLSDEFTRLFIGPGEHIPPYESVFTEDKAFIGGFGRMFGEAAAAVEETYKRHGWHAPDGLVAPDHLAAELGFMNFLVGKEFHCRQKNDDRLQEILDGQFRFVNDHLANWSPSFCRLLSNFSRFEFYKGIARLTEDFIVSEKAYLSPLASESILKS